MNVPGKEGQIYNRNDEVERIPFAWEVYKSNGRPDMCYFFNTITRETVWDVPVGDLAIVEKSKEEAAMTGFRPVSIASTQGPICSNCSSSLLICSNCSSSLLMPGSITTNRSAPSQTDSSQAGPSQSPFGYNHWPQMPDGSSGKEHSGIQPPRMDEPPGPSGGNYPANMHFSDPRVHVSDVGVPATASVVKGKHPRIQGPEPKKIAKQTSGNLRCGPSFASYALTIADPKLTPKTQNIDISKVTPALLAEAHKRTLKMDEPPKGTQIAEKKLKLKCPEPNEEMYQNGELIDATKAKGNKAERKMITFGGEDTIWRHTKVIDSSKTINKAVEESTSVAKPLLQVKPTHREIEMQALITSEQQQNRNNEGLLEDNDGQSDSGEVSVSDYWDYPPSIAVQQERFRSIRTKMEHAFKLIVQTFNDLRNWNSKEPLLSDLLDFLLKKYSYSDNTRAEWIMCQTILPLKNLVLKEMCGGLKAVKLIKKSHLVKFYKLSYKTSKQLKTFNPEMVDLDVIMLEIQNIGRQLQPMTQPSDFTAPVENAPVQNDSNIEYNNQNRSNTSNYSDDVADGPPAVQRIPPQSGNPGPLAKSQARPTVLRLHQEVVQSHLTDGENHQAGPSTA